MLPFSPPYCIFLSPILLHVVLLAPLACCSPCLLLVCTSSLPLHSPLLSLLSPKLILSDAALLSVTHLLPCPCLSNIHKAALVDVKGRNSSSADSWFLLALGTWWHHLGPVSSLVRKWEEQKQLQVTYDAEVRDLQLQIVLLYLFTVINNLNGRDYCIALLIPNQCKEKNGAYISLHTLRNRISTSLHPHCMMTNVQDPRLKIH